MNNEECEHGWWVADETGKRCSFCGHFVPIRGR